MAQTTVNKVFSSEMAPLEYAHKAQHVDALIQDSTTYGMNFDGAIIYLEFVLKEGLFLRKSGSSRMYIF